jgi:site-specific recombinase XerD
MPARILRDEAATPTLPAATEDATTLRPVDHVALAGMHHALLTARGTGDQRPPLAILADSICDLGVELPRRPQPTVPLDEARDEWLRRLRSANRSASSIAAYRIALNDLLAFLDRTGTPTTACSEETLVAYLDDYRRRSNPAEATYYRRFTQLRRFFRWLSRRADVPDPFLELEPPGKPQQEADWLTTEEFARLLAAAGAPIRRRPGLAERDQLVLLTLVSTGLRRSELLALDWNDLDLESDQPSLLVRRGKGGRPRRQPLPPELADELRRLACTRHRAGNDPVFCGLAGKRLTSTILATLIRRAAERAGIEKSVSAHTLRHTAATWLRQQTGDARLVAAYLGHADLSTVSRYAHVADGELHDAVRGIALRADLMSALTDQLASSHADAWAAPGESRP